MSIEGRHDEQEEEEEAPYYAVSSGFFLGNEILSALSAQHVFFDSCNRNKLRPTIKN